MSDNNIELRSEKVRNVIGKIPPFIIRAGIGILFLVFIGAIVGSYYFEYNETLSIDASINKYGKTAILIVPQNKISQIKKGQTVIFNLKQTSNISIIGKVINTSDSLFIENNFAFYKAKVHIKGGGKIVLKGKTKAKANILIGKTRAFTKLIRIIGL